MSTKLHNTTKLISRRRELRKQATIGEKILWKELRNRQIEYRFKRQHSIGSFIVDFYCPKVRLIIEIDGPIHTVAKQIRHDQKRTDYFTKLSFNIVRYSTYQIKNELESVILDIYNHCDMLSTSPSPSSTDEGHVQST